MRLTANEIQTILYIIKTNGGIMMNYYDLNHFNLQNAYKKLLINLWLSITISVVVVVILLCYIKYQNKCIVEYQNLTSILLVEDK